MRINLRRATASVLAAAGLLWGGQYAKAVTVYSVGDPSFELTSISTPSPNDFYFAQGPPNSPYWKDHKNSTGKNRFYTANWASVTSPSTPDPHTGIQAVDGEGAYNWQVLPDRFIAGTTYTFTAWIQGAGGNTSDANDRFWLYLFKGAGATEDIAPGDFLVGNAGATAPGSMDGSSLMRATWHAAGTVDTPAHAGAGAFSILPFTGFARDAGSNWTKVGFSYTATGADAGARIGLGFWTNALGAVDDVGLTSVPEPSTLGLVGIGLVAGGWFVKRRRREG